MWLLPKFLDRIVRKGRLRLVHPDGTVSVHGGAEPGPEVTVRVADSRLDRKIPLNPELAVAEAYMDGSLTIEDGGTIVDLLAVAIGNRDHLQQTASQRVLRVARRASRFAAQYNPRERARRNAAHHYDLGNAFYRLWLDWDMQYSCAYFPDGDETLEEAQTAKKRHIAAKLRLEPGMRVFEIGCGWGGLALYLAAVADVDVHAVTLSKEQLAIAQARAKAAGLSDRVRFELVDYRDVQGRYDRVVSVAMLEAVGVGHLGEYFSHVRDRLGPRGVALVHTISQIDPPGSTSPFMRKYIFPGAYPPRLSEVARALETTGLRCTDVEVWRGHYARTLRIWRERFEAHRATVEATFDARFARMWEFYLASVEMYFATGFSHVLHVQMAREHDAVPLHRDYIAPAAAAFAAREPAALARLEAATAKVFGEVGDRPTALGAAG